MVLLNAVRQPVSGGLCSRACRTVLLSRLAQISGRFIVSACSPEHLHDLLDRPWLLERPDVPVGFVSFNVSASHYNDLWLLVVRDNNLV